MVPTPGRRSRQDAVPVTGVTLGGAWSDLGSAWTAPEGAFTVEPPGDTHTLTARPEAGHMTVLFYNFGPLISVDEHGNATGLVDVLTRIEACRRHHQYLGLGAGHLRSLIR